MKITVTAAKRDDIIKERDAYRAERKKQNDVHNQQYSNYQMANDFNFAQVEDTVRKMVPGLDKQGVRVSCEERFGGFGIEFNREDRGEGRSLRWRWSATIGRNGEVEKDSSSWSNIDVTSPEQVHDLMESAKILEKLVNIDWKTILESAKANAPKWEDYVSVRELPNRDSEFNSQLKLAAIEDLIGTDKWIKGRTYEEGRWNYGDRWYMIHSQTDKFFSVSIANANGIKGIQQALESGESNYEPDAVRQQLEYAAKFPERVKKEKILPCIYTPLEIMDMDGNVTVDNFGDEPEQAEASTNLPSGLITL